MVGSIRLGASPTVGPYLLPDVARRLHELYPALRLFIRDGAPRDLLADLLAGRHDLILTQLPVASAEVETVRLYSEPLHLAVARDHRLAGRARVNDADLAGETILALSSAFSLHDQIAALAREVGASLRQDYEGTSLDALRQMTAMNMGVTFLPALYVRSEAARPDGDVVVLPFRKGGFLRAIGLAWRRTAGDQAAYRALVEVIRGVVARSSGPLVRLDP
jgi:LysR family hydrogen peroxide-inducible transcriptional activator